MYLYTICKTNLKMSTSLNNKYYERFLFLFGWIVTHDLEIVSLWPEMGDKPFKIYYPRLEMIFYKIFFSNSRQSGNWEERYVRGKVMDWVNGSDLD